MRLPLLALLLASLPAPAAVVSFLNATGSDLTFTIEHKDAKPVTVTLPAGTTQAVRVGKAPVLRGTLDGKPVAFTLDPYTPYLFTAGEKGKTLFSGVELAGKLPDLTDVPALPADVKVPELPVSLFSDTAGPLVKDESEKQARATFAAASKLIEKHAGVRFTVADVGGWASAEKPADLAAAGADFETNAKPKGQRAVGFVGRAVPGEGFGVRASASHVLVKAGSPKSDTERTEVLAHHLAQWAGAVRSPDGGSLMRAKVGDGNSNRREWVTQFDPLNLIVLHVWAEELSAGKKSPEEFRPKARERLRVLYATIAAVHEATKSEDTQAREVAAAFATDAIPQPDPKPADPKPADDAKRPADEKAIRAVVLAVTKRAAELAETGEARPKGDTLTAEYVKAAAAAAAGVDEKERAKAFLVGIGIALDNTTVLRDKPVIGKLVKAVESEDERAARVKVLGRPTLHGRRDWCQHWAVSAALAEYFGEAPAELAGQAKEMADMKGASGFSFADLAADYAGIDLAAALNADPKRLDALAKGFAAKDWVPDPTPFDDGGLPEAAFKKKYGGVDDERFKKQIADVKAAVAGVPAFKKK